MGTGIIICGLNGAGKSTIGKALAKKIDFYFIDNEELYFPKTDPHYTYASPRTRKEVEQLLFSEIKAHKDKFDSIQAFYKELDAAKREYLDYKIACAEYEKTHGDKVTDTMSIRDRLRQYEQIVKERESGRVHQAKQKDKGAR